MQFSEERFPLGPALSALSPDQLSSLLSSTQCSIQDASILSDLPLIKHAESLFLNSRMLESELFCRNLDPSSDRLYLAAGYSLIQCLKAYMSHEDSDLHEALIQVKRGNELANKYRAPPAPFLSRISGFVGTVWSSSLALSSSSASSSSSSASGWGTNSSQPLLSANAAEVDRIRNMSVLQRHAELLYAETLVAKALLGVILSGNWLSFLSEAFNLRTSLNIYIALSAYLSSADTNKVDPTIDADFRSGIYLGIGACQLILSLMPQRLLAVASIFGYSGDRESGLTQLMKAGGWTSNNPEPAVGITQEGMRRPLADIGLLCFHLILSQVTYRGVDLDLAQRILNWNLARFPDGIFYLFAQGRLALLRSQPEQTILAHARATSIFAPSSAEPTLTSTHPTLPTFADSNVPTPEQSTQTYKSLHFISHWDLSLAHLSLWDIPSALRQFHALVDEGATWSRACYAYGVSSCLLQLSSSSSSSVSEGEKERIEEEARNLLESIPGLVHKIAGKSIPIEKFIARKARKFFLQAPPATVGSTGKRQGRLLLPALELAYVLQCIEHAPQEVLLNRMVPEAMRGVKEVEIRSRSFITNASSVEKADEELKRKCYWDDYCLAQFLLGVCWRFIAHPAVVAAVDESAIRTEDSERYALDALEKVVEHGPKIELDHYILYCAHYELGRLKLRMNNLKGARAHFELVLSGTTLESSSLSSMAASQSTGAARKVRDKLSSFKSSAPSSEKEQLVERLRSKPFNDDYTNNPVNANRTDHTKPIEICRLKGKYSMQSAVMMRTAAALEELELLEQKK